MLLVFFGELDVRYKRRRGIRDDFMVWGLSKKNEVLFFKGSRLFRYGN